MIFNHAAAIIRWRNQLDELGTGLQSQQSATISTMLFGCNSWLADGSLSVSDEETARVVAIRGELQAWLNERGLEYLG